MTYRRLVVLLVIGMLLVGCGTNEVPESAQPAPTRVAQVLLTRAPAPSPFPTSEPTVVSEPTAVPTQAPTEMPPPSPVPTAAATLPAVSTQSVVPNPEGFHTSKETSEFAERLQAAVFALENLPGYTYSVTDPSLAPNLVLMGRVAGPDRREWTVHEQGSPERIVARWVLVDGKAYTDRTGKWEIADRVPFDPSNPISFASGFMDQLFEAFLPDDTATEDQRKVEVGGRAVTRYTLVRKYPVEEQMDIPEGMGPTESTDTVWIATEGGYLLRYTGSSPLGMEADARRTVEITPLKAAPDIQAPRVGTTVFDGAPPPWRASVIGRDRLGALKSYRYSYTQGPDEIGQKGEGRVSATQGSLSGAVFDPSAVPTDPGADPTDWETTEVELVYTGGKAWARVEGGSWRRISTNLMASVGSGDLPEAGAFQLVSSVPGEPPRALLGNASDFAEMLDAAVFGVVQMDGGPVLTEGKLLGRERVNGVQALHYQGTTRLPGDASARGTHDLWLAEDGLYTVRSRMDLETFQQDASGLFGPTTELDIYDANKTFTIKPPVP